MKCYFQGCSEQGVTKEHIPPRAFFPDGETLQLLTVKSCVTHNNAKSRNDLYVLAQICMTASPSNRARDVFLDRVVPQLLYNNDALRKMLLKGSKATGGGVAYAVETARLDEFFTALSCGLIYKSQKVQLPSDYTVGHIYHRFSSEGAEMNTLSSAIDSFMAKSLWPSWHLVILTRATNGLILCEIHGLPDFQGSITIVHRFFGVFNVTSMLTRHLSFDGNGPLMPDT